MANLPMHPQQVLPLANPLPETQPVGAAATRLLRGYSGTPIDVSTYHYNNNRTGWNQTETDLTPATVKSAKFGLLATLNVDGNVFAQPLLLSNFVMPDNTTHDVLVIATGHNTVYAFDAQTYAVLWHVSLGPSQSSIDIGCGDILPEYGITATPVILRTAANAATLYVVAATEPAKGVFTTTLHALNLGTGIDVARPATINPSAKLKDGTVSVFNPRYQYVRAGLATANNGIYLATSSHCDADNTAITGWMMHYSSTLNLLFDFHTISNPGGLELASVWMSGFAPAIDAAGNVYVATGNGKFTPGGGDWGMSVLKLVASLSGVRSSFTPSNVAFLNAHDADFGSGGVMLLPVTPGQTAPPMAVALGKWGIIYLMSQSALGGFTPTDSGVLSSRLAGGSGLWGGPAFYNGPAGPTIFYQTGSDVLKAWKVGSGARPVLTLGASGTAKSGYGGSLPVVSSNGGTASTGVVWLINRAFSPFMLEAYDAVALGAPIFSAAIGTWSNPKKGNPFLTAMVANGRVYAPGYQVVQVYGLTP